MMSQSVHGLPNPTPAAMTFWLKRLDRGQLHDTGWVAVNKRFHGLARAARPFINQHFATPEEQEAAFDGLTLALMTMAHFGDVEQLATLFQDPDEEGEKPGPKAPPHKRNSAPGTSTTERQAPGAEVAPQSPHEDEDRPT